MTDAATDAQRVRTLEDLKNWSFDGTALAVLGDPIAHSLSPVMHNAALNAMAQTQQEFANWRYFKFHVRPEELPQALEQFHAAGFRGLNLTLPHKIEAISILGKDAVSDFARIAGAANTLTRADALSEKTDGTALGDKHTPDASHSGSTALPTDAGTRPAFKPASPDIAAAHANGSKLWRGDNTDGCGLQLAMRHELGFEMEGSTVLLLGAGGAARAAAVYCLTHGVRNLWVANRTAERLDELVTYLRSIAGAQQEVHSFTATEPPSALPLANMAIINATSIGLKAGDPSPINLRPFDPKSTVVYDMTYGIENTLCRDARDRSIPFADGLAMLVWQGARALETWTGANVPAHIMRQALQTHMAQKSV